jgi:hypothetical protein
MAAARVSARAERLGRMVARQTAREDSNASAVTAHLRTLLYPETVQPGIFDHRATRAAAAASEHAVAIDEAVVSRHTLAVREIRVGRPRLVFDGRSRQ